jgi:hypothetical protein
MGGVIRLQSQSVPTIVNWSGGGIDRKVTKAIGIGSVVKLRVVMCLMTMMLVIVRTVVVMTMTITIRRTIIKVTVGYLIYAVEQFSSSRARSFVGLFHYLNAALS